MSANVLLLDIETLPNVVAVFSQKVPGEFINPDAILQERTIVCAAWKWLGKSRVKSVSVLTKPGNEKYPDLGMLHKLHDLLTLADAVIAHNGDRFDVPWALTRFAIAGLPAPPAVTVIDTLQMARRKFLFNSNRLDYVAQVLGVGSKVKTDFDLWKRALAGSKAAIREMVTYCKHDVELLEGVYLKLRPFVPAKLNLSLFESQSKQGRVCPTCGAEALIANGSRVNRVTVYHRFRCTACGAHSQKPERSTVVR